MLCVTKVIQKAKIDGILDVILPSGFEGIGKMITQRWNYI